jgi:hypothetical protein
LDDIGKAGKAAGLDTLEVHHFGLTGVRPHGARPDEPARPTPAEAATDAPLDAAERCLAAHYEVREDDGEPQ